MNPRGEDLTSWILRAADTGSAELPVFPSVAVRLVDLLEHPGAEVRDAAELIAQDQTITLQVLRTANSALYGAAMPAESVSQAVMRVGFREAASIAMTAACRSLYDVEDRAELETLPGLWSAVWHESLVCAYGGRLIARELKTGDPDQVFMAGLLQNVGDLRVLKALSRGLVTGALRVKPDETAIATTMQTLRGRLAAPYLLQCSLPAAVVELALSLHGPEGPALWGASGCVLALADGLCDRIGIAPFATGELGAGAQEALARLEPGDDRLEVLELQLQELATQVQELL